MTMVWQHTVELLESENIMNKARVNGHEKSVSVKDIQTFLVEKIGIFHFCFQFHSFWVVLVVTFQIVWYFGGGAVTKGSDHIDFKSPFR